MALKFKASISKDGLFDIRIPKDKNRSNHGFVSFGISTHDGEFPICRTFIFVRLEEVYPSNDGDDIELEVNKHNNLHFKGNGALKYNCTASMYRIKEHEDSQKEKLMLQNGDYHNFYLMEGQRMEREISRKKRFINKYRGALDFRNYKQLCLDAIATTFYDFVRPMSWTASFADAAKKITENKLFLHKYLTKYIVPSVFMENDYSAYYADFLFEVEKLQFELDAKPNEDSSRWQKGKIPFPIFCKGITRRYKGVIKDKLLAMAFLELPDIESKPYIEWGLKEMKNPYFKSILGKYAQKYKSAYPFVLTDEHGMAHHLSEYKGKLVIVDYWFTGCKWCSVLHTAMHAITERYKYNRNVIFLSINVDKEVKTWENSLGTNVYSSREYTNLSTGGLGTDHPAVSYYGYNGFPQLLLIGAGGEVISSNPPRPQFNNLLYDLQKNEHQTYSYNDISVMKNDNTKAFINLIDTYLVTHHL